MTLMKGNVTMNFTTTKPEPATLITLEQSDTLAVKIVASNNVDGGNRQVLGFINSDGVLQLCTLHKFSAEKLGIQMEGQYIKVSR